MATPKRRIRYITQGRELIAQVEQRTGLLGKWLPTNVQEVINLDRAAEAMRIFDARKGSHTSGIYDDFTGGYIEFSDSTAGIYDADVLYADTSGFGDRFKRFAKKIAKSKVGKAIKKVHVAPLKIAHKITHGKNSPIRKAELALQKTVTKALPFTKPFINVHNQLASKVHKTVDKATGTKTLPAKANPKDVAALIETTRRVQASAISNILKKAPAAHKEAIKKTLIQKATAYTVKSPQTGITYSFLPSQLKQLLH
jgi:hypothetical protein